MGMKLKTLLTEILVEALFGKKFRIKVKGGAHPERVFLGMATANAKPNERPYRITWFSIGQAIATDFPDNRHVDLSLEEMNSILEMQLFPPKIIQRIKDRYSGDKSPLIGDEYTIG